MQYLAQIQDGEFNILFESRHSSKEDAWERLNKYYQEMSMVLLKPFPTLLEFFKSPDSDCCVISYPYTDWTTSIQAIED